MRRQGLFLVILAAISGVLLLPVTASAATLVPLAPSSSWASTPIHGASPPGDPRLFVAERGGAVRIVKDGNLLATPFLTIPGVDTSGERGLLSIAFPPDYASNGLFYVFVMHQSGPGIRRIVEYRRSASDPDLADPGYTRVLFEEPGPDSIHNGGQLAFGPDGYLYVTMGEAGTPSNAQFLGNNLGKVLRIDPHDPPAMFGIPPSNPFASGPPGTRPETYSYGLRNPYRASFAPNGDLIVADVGSGSWEEVNVGRATGTPVATTLAGANLGWPICEGACSEPSLVNPFFQYGHGLNPPETIGCAIVGGYVVRHPELTGISGRYLYGDFCRPDLRTLDLNAPGGDPRPAGVSLPPGGGALLGFGEDGRGCVYAMTTATVYRVAESPTDGAACPPSLAKPPGPTTDTKRPALKLRGNHRQRLRRFVTIFASCDEPCSLRADGVLGFAGPRASASASSKLRAATASVPAGKRAGLRPKLRAPLFRRAKQALQGDRKVTAKVQINATDGSGNVSKKTFRIKLIQPKPRGQ